MKFHDDVFTLAKKLSLAFAPTGCEKRALDLIEEELKEICECSRDRIGNLICRLPGDRPRFEKGEKPERIAFVCGVDETGFMITKIDDKGYLRFERTGDADPSAMLGKKMLNVIIQHVVCHVKELNTHICAVQYDNLHNLLSL